MAKPTSLTIAGMTCLAMVAFAANSLLCRFALEKTAIDPASFTAVRVVSGAVALWLILKCFRPRQRLQGNWLSALFLFGYAAGFSFAYVSLPTAVGALLLFGAVQATMIGYGMFQGERLKPWQSVGLASAIAGLVVLLLPGLSAPPLQGAALMVLAGVSWGGYSLLGRGVVDPVAATAGNFVRAGALVIVLSLAAMAWFSFDAQGVGYAVVSGALTSGVGYAVWYAALRGLNATTAATVQLSVPVLAAAAGVVILHEEITLRLLCTSVAILGGIAMFIFGKRRGKLA